MLSNFLNKYKINTTAKNSQKKKKKKKVISDINILYYDRNGIPEGIGMNRTSESKVLYLSLVFR